MNLFSFNFPLRIFLYFARPPPPPYKFSNGPSLSQRFYALRQPPVDLVILVILLYTTGSPGSKCKRQCCYATFEIWEFVWEKNICFWIPQLPRDIKIKNGLPRSTYMMFFFLPVYILPQTICGFFISWTGLLSLEVNTVLIRYVDRHTV